MGGDVAKALEYVLSSPAEVDGNLEPANIVDAVCKLARAIYALAEVMEKQGAGKSELKKESEVISRC